ncbi:hypothetical protein [Amycolatopsis echigonensis]|uniref:Uncharacterized protein n=1 Tax=Amycolatopsis echigonensis TaxID=2576905 RepID=A0A8E1W7E0_9PSEU|nr:hypothetical protein [Amycolatopsis echigonensis]MBB2505794.1 hypothetical protein [Amycolatopsis echigonensis]
MTARSVHAELLRLRSDYLLPGFAVLTLVLSAAVNAGQQSDPSAGLAQATVIAMIFGSIRYTLDARNGLIARAVLASGRGPALLAKAVVTATAGAVIGVLGGLCTAVVTGLDGSVLPDLFGTMLSAAAGAVIGLCVGVLVRNHFAAPVAVLAVHLGSILVLQSWPAVGAVLPLGATMALVSDTQPDLLPQPAAIAVLLAWTAIASACSWLAMTMRDLG